MRIDHSKPEYFEAMELYMTGDRFMAKKAFEELVRKYPDDPALLLLLGNINYSLGQLCEACEDYENVLSMEPINLQATFKLGVCFVRMGKLKEALVCFRKNVENPEQGHVMSYYWLGLINSFMGNDEAALEAFNQLHEKSGESLLANYFLAQLHMKRHENGKAIELLDDLLTATPGFADVHYLMGLALAGMHENTAAVRKFRTALELNPEDRRARSAIEMYMDVPSI